jgi:hypothetical protein
MAASAFQGASGTQSRHLGYIADILDRELLLTLRGVELGSKRDDSMKQLTDTAATLYDGRILRELIQNAYDGSGDHPTADILLRLDLSQGDHGVLDVANSGKGFTQDDVDSIVNPALSKKRPGNSIGHKGLGFRSVGLITDDPQIFSTDGIGRPRRTFDGYCFSFASNEVQRARLKSLSNSPHIEKAVGRTHRLQLPVPLIEQPRDVRWFAQQGYATVVRLPLKSPTAADQMTNEWQSLFDERAPLVLFLPRIASLVLERVAADHILERRVMTRRERSVRDLQSAHGLSIREVEVDSRRYLTATTAVDRERFMTAVRDAIKQQHRVEKWLEWEGDPLVSIALPLAGEAQDGCYYAFLPMKTASPFQGFLDGPFFPDPDRRDLALSNALNDMLLDVVAETSLALVRTLAANNETRAELVHAAMDALAWNSDRGRIFRAVEKAGMKKGDIPLPVVKLPDIPARWSDLSQVFDWEDDRYLALKASWMAKVTGEHLLRRNMGARRVSILGSLASEAELALEPGAARLAKWVPQLVADLGRRRKLNRQSWEWFYADLVEHREVLPHLRGSHIFRNEAGRLVAAESGDEKRDGGGFFISADAERSTRRRRRLNDASLMPPAGITKGMDFADPGLSWPPAVVAALVEAGLASEFRLIHVLGRAGQLLGEKPRRKEAMAALTWAFLAWRSHRSADVEKAVRSAGLYVPTAAGSVMKASSARFSAGWRDTLGDILAELCAEASSVSRVISILTKQLLPSWSEWPLALRGTLAEWTTFLKLAGVQDGLPVHRHANIDLDPGGWSAFRLGRLPVQAFENTVGTEWRAQAAVVPWRFNYQSRVYQAQQPHFLAGQGRFDQFSSRAKYAFAKLAAHAVASLPDEAFETYLRRIGGNSDWVRWPSPLHAFFNRARWLPVAGPDEFEGLAPSDCWYGTKEQPLPRFVPRIDRDIRDLIDGNEKLRDVLTKRLGLPVWADSASSGRRIVALGSMLRRAIPEADLDSFRKAYREAWDAWSTPDIQVALPSQLDLAVESASGLAPLALRKDDPERATVFVGDGSRPSVEQILSALGHAVLPVPDRRGARCAEALNRAFGAGFQEVRPESLQVELAEGIFEPGEVGHLLVADGRDWLAEVAVLILEFSSRLTSQSTARSRQEISEAVRRVRIRFSEKVTVSIAGVSSPLPEELDGVLPMPHPDHPTVIVQGGALHFGWSLFSRIAAALPLAIGRSWLVDPFRLIFLALEREMRSAGDLLEAPSDEALAAAFGKRPQRIRELLRSLRSTTTRLLEFLAPAVHASGHPGAAEALLKTPEKMLDDNDVVGVLALHGVDRDWASDLVAKCRDADNLNRLRRAVGVDFADFNNSLVMLGRSPLSFEDRLREDFGSRIDERRAGLEAQVRDGHSARVAAGGALQPYREGLSLDWMIMPVQWASIYDETDDATIDAAIAEQVQARLGPGPFEAGEPLDRLRQANRQLLSASVDRLRRLMRAWAAKDPARTAPKIWESPADLLARAAVTSGTFDFERLTARTLPAALHRADLWPANMDLTDEISKLGLTEEDLAGETQAEQRRQETQLRERRSVTFGEQSVDGGAETCLEDVAQALEAALASDEFRQRSGRASLNAFSGSDPTRKRRGKRGPGGDDPVYLTEEQRLLLGFAGELAAYRYLKRTLRGFPTSTGCHRWGADIWDFRQCRTKTDSTSAFLVRRAGRSTSR